MKSLRDAVRKKFQIIGAFSVDDLASRVRLRRTFSVRQLLDKIDPDWLVFSSGPLKADSVKASASLGVTRFGRWFFRGGVHEDGFVGHNYVFAVSLGIQDPSGALAVIARDGSVHGTFAIGSRNDDFDDEGEYWLIASKWEQVKRGRVAFRLTASTSVLDTLQVVVAQLFVDFVVVVINS